MAPPPDRSPPTSDRLRYCAQSALDHSWMDLVDDSDGVLITAKGLFQYFDRTTVFESDRGLRPAIPRWPVNL